MVMKKSTDVIKSMHGRAITELSEESHQPRKDDIYAVSAMQSQMNAIFSTLKTFYTAYGRVMKTEKQEASTMKQWAFELVRGNVRMEMLGAGMARAKSHASEDRYCNWPSVADFISWCHRLPTPDMAYMEASKNSHAIAEWEPSHPAVYLAGQEVTWYEFRNNNDQRGVKQKFFIAYGQMCARVISGESLTYEKPMMIERRRVSKEEDRQLKEVGRSRIGGVKALLGEREPEPEKKEIPAPEHKPDYAAIEKRKRDIAKLKANLEKGGDL